MILVSVAANSTEARARLEAMLSGSTRIKTGAAPGDGDVVLMEDPGRAALAELPPAPVVILLSDLVDARAVSAAWRAGVRGVLARDSAGPVELESALLAAHAGLMVSSPETAFAREEAENDGEMAEPLSEREIEVLDLVAAGLANKVIAYQLGITEHTVKSHMSSIFAKLGAGSRTEAVSLGVRRGLVML